MLFREIIPTYCEQVHCVGKMYVFFNVQEGGAYVYSNHCAWNDYT
jgi:hypothetical protein